MKKNLVYIIISVMGFWCALTPVDAVSDESNQTFLDMINRIRSSPYNYAIDNDLGTPEALIAKGILPETRFEPYALDLKLNDTAVNESKVMAGEDPSGVQIISHRRLTASTGGVVSFFNFMSRDTAFKIIIDYLFKKEIDSHTFDYILSERYSFAGIGMSAGKIGSGNAWFAVIRLGSSVLVSEIQMLNLINDVRGDPSNIWKYEYNGVKMDQVDVFKRNPDIPDLFVIDYKPLFLNSDLSASASQAEAGLGVDPYHGYTGEVVQDSEVVFRCLEESSCSVDFLFFSLLYKELNDWPLGHVVFLNDVQDVGSSISFMPGDGEVGDSILSFVVGGQSPDVGSDENANHGSVQTARIYGLIFLDGDGNGLYGPGEELARQTVTVSVYIDNSIENVQVLQCVATDNAGHFSMSLDTGRHYRFETIIGEIPVVWDGFIASDQFVKLAHTPLDALTGP